jgi:hypothetical protein
MSGTKFRDSARLTHLVLGELELERVDLAVTLGSNIGRDTRVSTIVLSPLVKSRDGASSNLHYPYKYFATYR